MKVAVALVLLAACGRDDPCAEVAGTCVTLEVEAPGIDRIDQLELDLLYDGVHATTTSTVNGAATFPIALAVKIAFDAPLHLGIVAAGKLAGRVLVTGAGATDLAPGQHATISLGLAAPESCTSGAFYCGGDKVAGDPQTLYQCNGGGVPLARGRCLDTCSVTPAVDDTCRGDGTCVDGGFYCGGDKLDGDPQRLYRCMGGVGVSSISCTNGCTVNTGTDDLCR